MRIKEIEIDNFKSFRSKTTIPLLDGFTTISGPNGSGKSNIIDCILFSLGLSSSRTLRAEKLSDLINNNSQRKEASVRITFTDEKDDTQTFEVKRKIKAGSNGYNSTYYLNNSPTTLTEIHKTLSDHNVSPGSYNVMMQGDVTGIINMTPTERRKIIDEIAGVAEFDRRITQALEEIEKVNDRIDRSKIILTEIDTRIEQLANERDLALQYQKLKENKQLLINQISLVKYGEIKDSLDIVLENINNLSNEKSSIDDNLKNFDKQLENAQALLDELNEKVKIKGEDEHIHLTKQVEVLKGEIFRKEQELDFKDKRIKDNNISIQKAHTETQNLLEHIDDAKLKEENKQDQLQIVKKQIATEKSNLNKLLEESSDLNKMTQGFIEKRSELRNKLEIKEDEKGRLSREKLKWEDIYNRLNSELEDLKDLTDNTESNKSILKDKRENLIKEIQSIEEEKSACETQISNNLNEIKRFKADMSRHEDNFQKLKHRLMVLDANKKAAEEANLGRAADMILKANLPGVHKTIAQLGKTDKDYELALSTAMGGRMQNIVVDNEHVGSEAIRFLRNNRGGRATFLPLNKISYYKLNKRLPMSDGVIDFAINLVEYDTLYTNIFQYALGDTLVVRDIEASKQLMGSFRMVTLDGNIVEKSGAMTGGSQSRSTLKFANTYNEEMKDLSVKYTQLKSEQEELKNELIQVEKKGDRYRQEYSNFLNTLHQKKLDLDSVNKSIDDIENNFQHNLSRKEEVGPKLNEAMLQTRSLEEEVNELEITIENLRQEIEDVDSKLPKDKLEKIEELTGNIEFEIKSLESKVNNIETDIKKLNIETELKTKSLDFQKEKIEQCKVDIKTLEESKIKIKVEISTISNKVKELNNTIDQLSSELKEIQKKRDQASQEVLNIQKNKNDEQHKTKRIEESLTGANYRRKELLVQLKELKIELKEKNIDLSKAKELNTTTEKINKAIERLTKRMEALEPVNMLAIKEYDEVSERKGELSNKIETLTTEKDELNNRLNSYESLKKEAFITTFDNVNKNFQEIFSSLSDGEGHLIIENPEDPFKGGLTIVAKPRGKKLLRIEAMSGGEKSLTALAFVFSFQRYMPAPFYAFDEVDMFLDGVNVEKLAEMIKTQASNAQFIVVSLRKPMIEKADRTVGVSQRKDGITKVTGVKIHD